MRGRGILRQPGSPRDAGSPKGQLKQAGRRGAVLAVLVGLDELGPGLVRLHAMDGGGEEDVAAAGLARLLRVRLGKES